MIYTALGVRTTLTFHDIDKKIAKLVDSDLNVKVEGAMAVDEKQQSNAYGKQIINFKNSADNSKKTLNVQFNEINTNNSLRRNAGTTITLKIDNANRAFSKDNKLGHAYADRIIIGPIGSDQDPKQATLYLFPQDNNLLKMKYHHINANKTGTETKGNVALATAANNNKGEAIVQFKAEKVFVGAEEIQVNLETAIADIGGKVQSNQTTVRAVSATALSLNYDLYIVNFNMIMEYGNALFSRIWILKKFDKMR